jgi:Flp pilus assembly pilin Flp
MKLLLDFSSDDSGNTAIEYALIMSLVALMTIPGISLIHKSLVASLQAMAELERTQEGYVAMASVQKSFKEVKSPVGGSLTDKLADLRIKKEKGSQGAAVGHIIGNGINKIEGEDKLNKDEILSVIDENKKDKKDEKDKKEKKDKKDESKKHKSKSKKKTHK